MKVLVIGGGGREHAIAWKLSQSSKVDKLYCAPGNAGMNEIGECIDIKAEDIDGLLEFARSNAIELTVVGPEAPLNLGIVDVFKQHNMRIFGPAKAAALLEGSKAFSKDFMKKYSIPTALYNVYEDYDKAVADIDAYGFPVVIKADGLAAGKGVIIADDKEQAEAAIREILLDKKFGEAGSRVVIEEFLTGKEASIMAFVDGTTAVPMVSAQDYKRALDGDKGLNTGGMGAVSPAFHYDEAAEAIVKEQVIHKTLWALKAEGIDYKGVLYFGLMLTADGPKVLEYNTRFGDPETEVVLPRLKTDLVDIMEAVIDERLSQLSIEWKQEAAVGVVMASGGYPEDYKTGYEITGLKDVNEDIIVLHSGTASKEEKTVTTGGRVLVVTALGETVEAAREKVYSNLKNIRFENSFYRSDI